VYEGSAQAIRWSARTTRMRHSIPNKIVHEGLLGGRNSRRAAVLYDDSTRRRQQPGTNSTFGRRHVAGPIFASNHLIPDLSPVRRDNRTPADSTETSARLIALPGAR